MPLTIRGSVNARFSVRFSAARAVRNAFKSLAITSMPPGSAADKASSPPSTCKDARRLVPASVSTSEPLGKSNAARVMRPASFEPGDRQCSRPAIIK